MYGTFWWFSALNTSTTLIDFVDDHTHLQFSLSHKDEEVFWLLKVRYSMCDGFRLADNYLNDRIITCPCGKHLKDTNSTRPHASNQFSA